MSYVDFNTGDLKRMLSILSEHFGDKPMSDDDISLKSKLEVMHKAEIEWEDE